MPQPNLTLDARWMDDHEKPGTNIGRYFEDWPNSEDYYASCGEPCYRIARDAPGSPKMQPYRQSSLQLLGDPSLKHEVGQEFITMTRNFDSDKGNADNINADNVNDDTVDVDKVDANKVDDDQSDSAQHKITTLFRVIGGSLTEFEFIVVPATEMAALEAQGWGV